MNDQAWGTVKKNSFYVLARCNCSIWRSQEIRLRKPYSGLKTVGNIDMPVLGLAGCHGRKWKSLSRYVDWASPIHITVQQMRLRWMETSEAHSIPLHENWKSKFMNSQNKEVVQQSTDRSFTSIQMVHTHTTNVFFRRFSIAVFDEPKGHGDIMEVDTWGELIHLLLSISPYIAEK